MSSIFPEALARVILRGERILVRIRLAGSESCLRSSSSRKAAKSTDIPTRGPAPILEPRGVQMLADGSIDPTETNDPKEIGANCNCKSVGLVGYASGDNLFLNGSCRLQGMKFGRSCVWGDFRFCVLFMRLRIQQQKRWNLPVRCSGGRPLTCSNSRASQVTFQGFQARDTRDVDRITSEMRILLFQTPLDLTDRLCHGNRLQRAAGPQMKGRYSQERRNYHR
ncbi:hypothetical protein C8R44DRAFT_789464 [Mycena epipterygia]|nr:hypothetical protein C8R44DRAFT_789464 [Mycena epipterygia]